jgi:hypothetical protein
MRPLFFTLSNKLRLMAIPDTHAHMDGHPVISYTYSLYIDRDHGSNDQAERKETSLHLDKNSDPDYLGYITFEQPAHVFSYTPGQQELTIQEVEEVIERLTIIRDNPSLWQPITGM